VIRMQRSPYGTSLPGAGTVHHINLDSWTLSRRLLHPQDQSK
jgi:hypothetical protein